MTRPKVNLATAIRVVAFVLGCVLTLTPAALGLQFAIAVGDPPGGIGDFVFFFLYLFVGLVFGLGPMLVGLPALVSGAGTPRVRLLSGVFLVVSMAGVLVVGFSGSVTRIASPIILLSEAALFAGFIWPARAVFAKPAPGKVT